MYWQKRAKNRIIQDLANELKIDVNPQDEFENRLTESLSASNWAKQINLDQANDEDLKEIFGILHSRRLQWDSLLWQVPLISLTGVSFLFTIIFSPATSRLSRIEVCLLTIIVSYASLITLARHRLSEVYESNLMQDLEKLRFSTKSATPISNAINDGDLDGISVHGKNFKNGRDRFRDSKIGYFRRFEIDSNSERGIRSKKFDLWDFLIVKLNKKRTYPVWMFVFILFMLTALVSLLVTMFKPGLFGKS